MNTISFIRESCIIWMTAIIWIIQLIVYPTFRKIQADQFPKYHAFHVSRITAIVAFPMLLEMGTGYFLYFNDKNAFNLQLLICIHLIFISTFTLSVPFHDRLKKEFNSNAINQLVNFNWIRTILWSYELIVILLSHSS